jgi:hypothetical protein
VTRFWQLLLVVATFSASAASESAAFNAWSDQALAEFGMSQKISTVDSGTLRTAKEDWVVAAKLVASDSGWRAWRKDREAVVNNWISEQSDQPEWIVGWAHDFIEPGGAARKWSVADPVRNDSSVAVEKLRGGWVYYFRMNNVERVVEAARLFRLTGNTVYSDWAISQLLFYAENYSKWPLQTRNGLSRMMGQSLDEAVVAGAMLDAVRLLGGRISSAQRIALKRDLFSPMANNLLASYQGINNISLWHACAVTLIGLEFGDNLLIAAGLDGDHGVRTILAGGVTKQLFWHEGSFGYQNYAIRSLLPLFLGADLRGKGALLKREKLGVQAMLLSPSLVRFDDGLLPSPGDVIGTLRSPDVGLFLEAYRTLPTRVGLIEASRRKSWDTLLDPVPTPPAPGGMPAVATSNAPESQFSLLKKSDWQVFIRHGQLVVNHAQEDATSYELYWLSTPVSRDPGIVSYGSDLYGNYLRKAIAHNVPLIDGNGQKTFSKGTVLSFDAAKATLEIEQPAYRDGIQLRRAYAIDALSFIDRATVTIASENEVRRIGLLTNFDCSIALPEGAPEMKVFNLPDSVGFKYWTGTRVFMLPPKWSVKLDCGGAEFQFQISTLKGQIVYFGSVPTTPPPSRRNAIYVETPVAKSVVFETKISPVKKIAP